MAIGMKASWVISPRASSSTIIAALTVATIVSSQANAAPRPRFTVTDLGTLPGGYDTLPTKINNRGQVVGSTHTAGGLRVPFIYSDGVLTQITGIAGGGAALDVNDSGAVVGQISTQGFLYRDGVITDLNPLVGVGWVAASGINNSGKIAGWAFPVNGLNTAFLLDSAGVEFLPFLPGPAYLNTAYDINGAGQAAGDCSFLTGPGEPARARAVLYQDGQAIDLGTLPGGTYSLARAINGSGHVVGWSGLHAFLYRDGQMIDLGALPGDLSSYAYDVNSSDWAVGLSESVEENQRAFLHAGGKLYDLNDLVKPNSGWRLSGATGVNDRGQITGWGRRNGVLRGFLLTPQKH